MFLIYVVLNHAPLTDNLFALVVCVVLVIRQEKLLVPSGDTEILPGDLLVIAAKAFENRANLTLQEVKMTAKHRFCGKALREVETPPRHAGGDGPPGKADDHSGRQHPAAGGRYSGDGPLLKNWR